jgi:hypothetical protein
MGIAGDIIIVIAALIGGDDILTHDNFICRKLRGSARPPDFTPNSASHILIFCFVWIGVGAFSAG